MFEDLSAAASAGIFIVSAIMVWLAGARLARYADQIADHTNLGEGLLGLVLLGAITSLPELAVAVSASASGTPMLAINDVLGSASINLVILALADAVHGRHALTSTQPTPQMMLQSALVMLILALVVAPFVAGDRCAHYSDAGLLLARTGAALPSKPAWVPVFSAPYCLRPPLRCPKSAWCSLRCD